MIDEQLWDELESESPRGRGIVRRRVREDSARNLFVGVTVPAQQRVLLLSVVPDAAALLSEAPKTKALRTSTEPGVDPGLTDIRITLVAPEMARVFTPFVEDVLDAVASAATDGEAVEALLGRFVYWKNLLSGTGSEGLSDEKQRGLYGELWSMHHLVQPELGQTSVAAWTGPDRDDRDFQRGEVAIEVKTTILDNPPTVEISSERQSDSAPFRTLLLVVLSLDALPAGVGQTLNQLVDATANLLGDGAPHLFFHDKLLQYGYADIHRELYEQTHYTLCQLWTFRVGDGFPRLTENSIPEGIGKVHYRLSLDACEQWKVEAEDVAAALRSTP